LNANSKGWAIFQTTSGNSGTAQINPKCPLSGQRATWTHLR
jgi:hypothetical protein